MQPCYFGFPTVTSSMHDVASMLSKLISYSESALDYLQPSLVCSQFNICMLPVVQNAPGQTLHSLDFFYYQVLYTYHRWPNTAAKPEIPRHTVLSYLKVCYYKYMSSLPCTLTYKIFKSTTTPSKGSSVWGKKSYITE